MLLGFFGGEFGLSMVVIEPEINENNGINEIIETNETNVILLGKESRSSRLE